MWRSAHKSSLSSWRLLGLDKNASSSTRTIIGSRSISTGLYQHHHHHHHHYMSSLSQHQSLSLRHFSCPSSQEVEHENSNDDDVTTTDDKSKQNYLVHHFQSLVHNGKATNDEHQLKALVQLDHVRNQILNSEFYTSYQPQPDMNSSSLSLGDYEELQTKSSLPTTVTNYFSQLLFSNTKKSISNPNNSIKGVYLHGGVGCGKTFCMNLFYDSLPHSISKQKVHFHSFMLNVHKQVCNMDLQICKHGCHI